MNSLVAVLLLAIVSLPAQSRVFDINSEKFAAYLRGTYAPTTIGKKAFENASNNGEVYDAEVQTLQGGEFGFIHASRYVNIKYAIEVVRSPSIKALPVTNAGGTVLYELNSDLSAVVPKIGFEFNLKQWQTSRVTLNLAAGQGNLMLTNAYSFTTDGTTATGITDYTEDGRGTATMLDAALAFESQLFDTTTFVVDLGYRQMKFTELKHNREAVTLNGTKTKGEAMLDVDGNSRIIDMTSAYVGIAFRFWIL